MVTLELTDSESNMLLAVVGNFINAFPIHARRENLELCKAIEEKHYAARKEERGSKAGASD